MELIEAIKKTKKAHWDIDNPAQELVNVVRNIYDDFEKSNNVYKLRNWRKNRNLTTPNYKVYFENILEELLEPLYDKSAIPEMVGEITDKYFIDDGMLDTDKVLDTINDISVFSINETELMGYNFDLTLSETIKEIDSRKQNPMQKEVWEKWGVEGKWQKDQNQCKSTLYVAVYDGCKF